MADEHETSKALLLEVLDDGTIEFEVPDDEQDEDVLAFAVIPARTPLDLLAGLARERGFRARNAGAVAAVLCIACHPDQPETLQRPDGYRDDWGYPRRGTCGLVTFSRHPDTPHVSHPLSVIPVAQARSLVASACCHDVSEALDGWDWESDLDVAIAEAVAGNDGGWALDWERAQEAHEAAVARQALGQELVAAAALLEHRLRVQAAASVIKDLGRGGVAVDQARLSWECGHVSETGDWSRVVVIVTASGLLDVGPDSCPEEHGYRRHGVPLDALAARYREVAALPEEERAKFKAAPERKKGGGGRRPASRKAVPVPDDEVDAVLLAVVEAAWSESSPLGARSLREAVRARLDRVGDPTIDARRKALVEDGRLVEDRSSRAFVYRLPEPLPEP